MFHLFKRYMWLSIAPRREVPHFFFKRDVAGIDYWLYGCWEPWNVAVIKHLKAVSGRELAFFLDVGANYGSFSICLASEFGEIIAVEPGVLAGHLLKANILMNQIKNIKLVEQPLTSKTKIVSFVEHYMDTGLSSVSYQDSGKSANNRNLWGLAGTELLEQTRLVNKPGMIKIDVEGHEFEVLRGLEDYISSHKPIVQIELNGANNTILQDFFNSHNYTCCYWLEEKSNWLKQCLTGERRFKLSHKKLDPNTPYQAVWFISELDKLEIIDTQFRVRSL